MVRIHYRRCNMPSTKDLATVAPVFIEMAHRIVWATVATVDNQGGRAVASSIRFGSGTAKP